MSEWISVYDRVPKEFEIVWVFWRDREVVIGYQTLSPKEGYHPDEHWYSLENEKERWAKYWMPIKRPKKPKTRKNDE